MIKCSPNEIENETNMKVADGLTTWRSQRARRAICRKSAQTFHLLLVKYEDEYKIRSIIVVLVFYKMQNIQVKIQTFFNEKDD